MRFPCPLTTISHYGTEGEKKPLSEPTNDLKLLGEIDLKKRVLAEAILRDESGANR